MLKDNPMDPFDIGSSLFSHTPERNEGWFMTLTYRRVNRPFVF